VSSPSSRRSSQCGYWIPKDGSRDLKDIHRAVNSLDDIPKIDHIADLDRLIMALFRNAGASE
jgi:hypothetical protein